MSHQEIPSRAISSGLKLKSMSLLKRARLRSVKARAGAASPKPRRPKAWWWRGASFLSIAYLVASQALLDLPGWSASAFGFAVLLAGLLVAGAYYGVWRLRVGTWLLVPLLFVCYGLLRCFSGISETSPFGTFAQLVSAFLGGTALALALRAGVSFKTLVYAQLAANLLQIVTVLSGLAPQPITDEETFRYAGITGNPNTLGLQLTFGACLIWLLPRKAGVLPCAFAFAAVAFALAVTGSRKTLLISLCFLVLVFIQSVVLVPRKRRRLMAVLAVVTLCLTGLFAGHWLYQNGAEILAVRRALDYDDSSYRTRSEMVQQGLQLWRQAPLFGNGLDAFRGLSGQGTYSHNNYVELLCNLGLVGALLFYTVYLHVLLRSVRAPLVLRFYCWMFILVLLLADFAYVSYTSKQAVMILMILLVVPTSRFAFEPSRSSGAPPGAPSGGQPKHHHARPRRFILGA